MFAALWRRRWFHQSTHSAGQIGESHEELIRTADHLRAGGLALRVPATEGDKMVAARILGQHGAEHIVYMGKWTHETLTP